MIGRSHAMLGATGYLTMLSFASIKVDDTILIAASSATAALTPVLIAAPSGVQAQRTRKTYLRDMFYKFMYKVVTIPYILVLLLCLGQWVSRLAPHLLPSHPGWIITWTAVAVGWSLIPDIDEASSTISNEFGSVSRAVSKATRSVAEHRGITHSWILPSIMLPLSVLAAFTPFVAAPIVAVSFVFAIRVLMPEKAHQQSVPLMLIAGVIGFAVAIDTDNAWPIVIAVPLGILLHDLGDWFTRAGIMFWYPYRKKYGLGASHAGSWSEIHFGQKLMIVIIAVNITYLIVIPAVNDPQQFGAEFGLSNYRSMALLTHDDLSNFLDDVKLALSSVLINHR